MLKWSDLQDQTKVRFLVGALTNGEILRATSRWASRAVNILVPDDPSFLVNRSVVIDIKALIKQHCAEIRFIIFDCMRRMYRCMLKGRKR